MSGEVVDFGFVSKEEAQVKRYKKPLKDAAMKEKKEREAMEKWNKELAEIEERKPMAEGVEPVVEAAVEVEEELPPQAVMAAAVPRTAAPFRKLRREIFFMVLSLL